MRVLVAVVMATFIAGAVAPAEAKVLVTINKSAQRLTVSVDGEPLYNWAVSTGSGGSRHAKREVPRVPHGEGPLLQGMG